MQSVKPENEISAYYKTIVFNRYKSKNKFLIENKVIIYNLF